MDFPKLGSNLKEEFLILIASSTSFHGLLYLVIDNGYSIAGDQLVLAVMTLLLYGVIPWGLLFYWYYLREQDFLDGLEVKVFGKWTFIKSTLAIVLLGLFLLAFEIFRAFEILPLVEYTGVFFDLLLALSIIVSIVVAILFYRTIKRTKVVIRKHANSDNTRNTLRAWKSVRIEFIILLFAFGAGVYFVMSNAHTDERFGENRPISEQIDRFSILIIEDVDTLYVLNDRESLCIKYDNDTSWAVNEAGALRILPEDTVIRPKDSYHHEEKKENERLDTNEKYIRFIQNNDTLIRINFDELSLHNSINRFLKVEDHDELLNRVDFVVDELYLTRDLVKLWSRISLTQVTKAEQEIGDSDRIIADTTGFVLDSLRIPFDKKGNNELTVPEHKVHSSVAEQYLIGVGGIRNDSRILKGFKRPLMDYLDSLLINAHLRNNAISNFIANSDQENGNFNLIQVNFDPNSVTEYLGSEIKELERYRGFITKDLNLGLRKNIVQAQSEVSLFLSMILLLSLTLWFYYNGLYFETGLSENEDKKSMNDEHKQHATFFKNSCIFLTSLFLPLLKFDAYDRNLLDDPFWNISWADVTEKSNDKNDGEKTTTHTGDTFIIENPNSDVQIDQILTNIFEEISNSKMDTTYIMQRLRDLEDQVGDVDKRVHRPGVRKKD